MNPRPLGYEPSGTVQHSLVPGVPVRHRPAAGATSSQAVSTKAARLPPWLRLAARGQREEPGIATDRSSAATMVTRSLPSGAIARANPRKQRPNCSHLHSSRSEGAGLTPPHRAVAPSDSADVSEFAPMDDYAWIGMIVRDRYFRERTPSGALISVRGDQIAESARLRGAQSAQSLARRTMLYGAPPASRTWASCPAGMSCRKACRPLSPRGDLLPSGSHPGFFLWC
jgi:hypothetical protein